MMRAPWISMIAGLTVLPRPAEECEILGPACRIWTGGE